MSFTPQNNRFHAVIHAGSIILAFITQVVSFCVFLLGKDSNVPNAIFQTSSRNVSETFPLEVTMDWWSEYYWIIIDLWSKIWLVDALVTACRRNVLGPESCNPEIHPPVFYHLWTTITIVRMYSMTLWEKHYLLSAALLRWILPVLSFYMLYISYSNLHKHEAWLAINNPRVKLCIRYLTQNGLAVFAWWSFLDAAVGLGVVLKYKNGVQDPLISSVILSIISFCVVLWFIFQIFPFRKYMRYTFSVYAILILGLGAMFTRSYRVHDFTANTLYCGFLMLLLTTMSFIHLLTLCLHPNQSRRPLTLDLDLKPQSCETVCQPEGHVKSLS